MKLFLSPTRYTVPVAILAAVTFLVGMGRFFAGSGGLWTIFGAAMFACTTAGLATKWPALAQLGASFIRWLRGGIAFSILGALPLTAAAVAAGQISWARNPYYSFYDPLLITRGPSPFVDTNGVPYMVDGTGQTVATVTASIVLTYAFFLVAGICGIALGLTHIRHSSAFIIIGTAILGGSVAGLASKGFDGEGILNANTVAFGILIACTAAGSAWIIARSARSTPYRFSA